MHLWRILKLFAFVAVGLSVVLAADLSQAVGENFLVNEENQMHSMVNQARAANGIGRVDNNDALRMIARRQTQAMTAAGYIYHSSDLAQQADAAALPWLTLGENVGKGPSVDAVQQAFMNSATHRANVLHRDYNTLGIGGMSDPQSILFFTQAFGALERSAPAPPPAQQRQAPAPRAPAPEPAQTQTPQTAQATAAPSVAPTPDQTTAPTPTSTSTTEPSDVLSGSESSQRANPGGQDDSDAERPPLWKVLLAMLGRFFEKIAFWQ